MRIHVGDDEFVVTQVRNRALLASLLLRVGEPVPTPNLVQAIWGEEPPHNARNQLQGCISRLRRRLVEAGGSRQTIATDPAGYRLMVDPGDIDLHEFRELLGRARYAAADGDLARANEDYRAALALWRGPALADIESSVIRQMAMALDEERIQAFEECLEIELTNGKAGALIPELTGLVRQHPYREKLHGALMVALYRAGRQADALAAYRDARQLLLDDLGTEPATSLQQLHHAILNRDPALDPASRQTQDSLNTGVLVPRGLSPVLREFKPAVPRTLPPGIPDFVGREKEVSQFCELLRAGREGGSVALVAIAGPAGIGKTALSVHVAHMLQDEYPDGQLYVNLRAFGKGEPAEPFAILGRFLRSLGVDGATLPDTIDERAELYRDVLSERRLIVVLDNAATDDQLAPLIPGGRGCGVIVNSRSRLGTAFGVTPTNLDVLGTESAVALVAQFAGAERATTDPGAVADLVRLCGHLPLAVRIAAGRLASKPHWSVRRLADRLHDERRRLDRLTEGQLDVRASIALSFAHLSEVARRLLCRLGDIDLPDVTPLISAALLDTSYDDAEEVLEQLYDAQLLDVARKDSSESIRYRLHDLVRLFAKERAERDELPEHLRAARYRAFAGLLSVVEAMHQRVYGGQDIRFPAAKIDIGEDKAFHAADPAQWCDDERQMIVAAVRRAAEDGNSEYCWGIACTASMLFQLRGYYDDIVAILDEASAIAREAGDRLGHAATLFRSGVICLDLQDYQRARVRLQEAAQLFRQVGDHHGEALATAHVATYYRWRGKHEEALRRYQRAVPQLRKCGDLGAEALALRCIGQIHLDRGNYAEADEHFTTAFKIAHASGSERSQAQVLFWRGMLRLKQRQLAQAASLFTDVRAITRRVGDRYGEAQAVRGLGLCRREQGDPRQAMSALSEALRLVRQPRPTFIEAQIQQELTNLVHEAQGAGNET